MTNEKQIDVIWFPTYRCNLKCPQCAARKLPIFSAKEIPYTEWITIFKNQNIRKMTISGREPFLFKGLLDVMNTLPNCEFHIESNLLLDMDKIIKPIKPKVTVVGTCHFAPGTKNYNKFIKNAKLLKANGFNIGIKYDMLASKGGMSEKFWEADKEKLVEDLKDVGVWHRYSGFDDMLLFNNYLIYGGSTKQCRFGYSHITISPDGRVFRCTGHIYQNILCMGDLKVNKINELMFKSVQPCKNAACTCAIQEGKEYDNKIVALAVKKIDIKSITPQYYYLISKDKMPDSFKE